ncbi:MAG: glycoside hydrolase family 13 protein [Nonomuraea sp.]|nr:glycoside hydrolase family 13 protein [Nonomuraea sp.]
MTAPWWQDAVIYQVYLRSFADSDGDGIGDLEGLRGRLDYLRRLGVDGIWLNPCYPSPQADHGYDVADYQDVDPVYGGLAAWDRLLADAHARGLKVLMDLVPNHCSVEHPWFQAALAGDREMRDRFLFRREPNNWRSYFGGPAWTQVDDEWYLHSFAAGQPDFNWRNPAVADYFDDVLRFWFDRGIDGLRIDVAHMMYKKASLEDWPGPGHNPHMSNQPEVHDVLRRWRKIADSYRRDLTLVGEIWVPTVDDLALFLRPDELRQAFYFDLLVSPWDPARFRASIEKGLREFGSTVTWTLSNHDVHRAVSRFGLVHRTSGPDTRPRGEVDVALGVRRARAALMLTLALPGSVYLFQGEEVGLPEVMDVPDSARQDPTFLRSGTADYGRDGCRIPLPWTTAGPSYGFSTSADTWLPQPDWFADFAVESQIGVPGSTWELYREALATRPTGSFEWLPAERTDVIAFRRGDLINVTVFGDEPYAGPWGDPVLSSGPGGDSTTWYRA